MKVGDLVTYNYGPAKGSASDHWGAWRGEIGVIVDSRWRGEEDVAVVMWFNTCNRQSSYKKYLKVISEVEDG